MPTPETLSLIVIFSMGKLSVWSQLVFLNCVECYRSKSQIISNQSLCYRFWVVGLSYRSRAYTGELCKGTPFRIRGGLEFFGNKYFYRKMGEINKWSQGLVEIKPIMR